MYIIFKCKSFNMSGIIYRGERVWKNWKIFLINKIRTLDENISWETILFWRWFIRKYGIDEIPQMVNLLLWDMVFFWVRPIEQIEFDKKSPTFKKLYTEKKPGIFWWHAISEMRWREYTKRDDEIFLRLQKIIEKKDVKEKVKFYTAVFAYCVLQTLWWHEKIKK